MIFHKLSIENFGVFGGAHDFILSPHVTKQRSRSITLIGGENGTGKTTWLEAILLCLYGKGVLRLLNKDVDYATYLRSRLHKPINSPVPSASTSVSLEFDHVHAGKVERFRVRREIKPSGDKAREKLLVFRNEEPVDDLDSEYWQDFLRELVPPGLCGLFFFDGEKIQRLIDDDLWNVEARNAIEALLGLDIVDRLKADLTIYETKSIEHPGTVQVRTELGKLQGEKERLTEELRKLEARRNELDNALHGVDGRIAEQHQAVMQHGGAYANQRISLEGEQRRVQKESDQIKEDIRDLCAELLPAALVPELCENLRSRLAAEAELTSWQSAEHILERALLEARDGAKDPALVAALQSVEQRLKRPASLEGLKPVHKLSYVDSTRTLGMLDEVQQAVRERARRLHHGYEKTHRALQNVLQQLNRVPSSEVLQPLVQELSSLHEERGRITKERDQLIENERVARHHFDSLVKDEERCLEALTEAGQSDERVQAIAAVRKALAVYRKKLLGDRLRRLASEVRDLFNQLSRKRNLLRTVTIDADTFAFTLQRGPDDVIRRDQLSAGERQLFAVALLWGLARVSGRPLPVIVDTPLGRLDSSHRTNLINKYFPYASHQVVLLSTDTEVDQKYFKDLAPHIAQAYRLQFDEPTGGTSVEQGYFWTESETHADARE
jgi:DNA sulfur modification protein DndD